MSDPISLSSSLSTSNIFLPAPHNVSPLALISHIPSKNHLKSRPHIILPSHSLFHSLRHSNTLLLSKTTPNNLHTNRHAIHQVKIIYKPGSKSASPPTSTPTLPKPEHTLLLVKPITRVPRYVLQPLPIRDILLPRNSGHRHRQRRVAKQIPDTGVPDVGTGFHPCPGPVPDPGRIRHDESVDAGRDPSVEVFAFVDVFVGVELGLSDLS